MADDGPREDQAIRPGDRVVAAHDLETTQELHIVEGTKGTVAEDRGSKLIVFFDEQGMAVNLTDDDLRKTAD